MTPVPTAAAAAPAAAALQRLRGAALLAAFGVLAGMGLRVLVDPWLGDSVPFLFAFPAVVLVARWSGVLPAVATALACLLWSALPVLPPNWHPASPLEVGAVTLALLATGLLAGRAPRRPLTVSDLQPNSSAERWLRLSVVLSVGVPAALFVTITTRSYYNALAEARARAVSTVNIALEHAARVIEGNVLITQQILEMLGEDSDAAIRARERELHQRWRRMTFPLQQIQSVWLWSADGRPLASNRFLPVPAQLNIADRDYFRHHRDRPDSEWYVTERLNSRASDEPFFSVTHARRVGGRFAGVVTVALFPAHFADFYRHLAEDAPGMAVSLLRADGAIIARWPPPPDEQPQRLRAGSELQRRLADGELEGHVEAVSPVDDRFRTTAFRRLDAMPLYVTAALDRSVVLAGWMRDAALLALLMFPLAIALLAISSFALRQARSELRTLQRLRAESEQLRRVEETLRQAQKLEALGRLTGGVAHDFNNLLTVVNNNAYLLARRLPQAAAEAGAIRRAVKTGEQLTRQLLAFSRRQAVRPEVLQLQQVLPDVAALIRSMVGARIPVATYVAPETPPVEVDRAELELALINLAVNARDAMPDGGRLLIVGRPVDPGSAPPTGQPPAGGYVMLSVADAGHGIPAALREKVYEPFFTTKPPGHGTGLGLSQVHGFCHQAGGTLRIDSEEGVGTTVTLFLPAVDKPATVQPPTAEAADIALGLRVLLVEDNPEVAQANRALLESFGCDVLHCESGEAALAAPPAVLDGCDVVLSDIVMPGSVNGVALAQALRQRRPELPMVLMTGYTAELHRALAAGIEVIPKPAPPHVVAGALRRAVLTRAAAGPVGSTPDPQQQSVPAARQPSPAMTAAGEGRGPPLSTSP